MNNLQIRDILININNMLGEISTRHENTFIMADCRRAIMQLIKNLSEENVESSKAKDEE